MAAMAQSLVASCASSRAMSAASSPLATARLSQQKEASAAGVTTEEALGAPGAHGLQAEDASTGLTDAARAEFATLLGQLEARVEARMVTVESIVERCCRRVTDNVEHLSGAVAQMQATVSSVQEEQRSADIDSVKRGLQSLEAYRQRAEALAAERAGSVTAEFHQRLQYLQADMQTTTTSLQLQLERVSHLTQGLRRREEEHSVLRRRVDSLAKSLATFQQHGEALADSVRNVYEGSPSNRCAPLACPPIRVKSERLDFDGDLLAEPGRRVSEADCTSGSGSGISTSGTTAGGSASGDGRIGEGSLCSIYAQHSSSEHGGEDSAPITPSSSSSAAHLKLAAGPALQDRPSQRGMAQTQGQKPRRSLGSPSRTAASFTAASPGGPAVAAASCGGGSKSSTALLPVDLQQQAQQGGRQKASRASGAFEPFGHHHPRTTSAERTAPPRSSRGGGGNPRPAGSLPAKAEVQPQTCSQVPQPPQDHPLMAAAPTLARQLPRQTTVLQLQSPVLGSRSTLQAAPGPSASEPAAGALS
eukprot:TRINITY_DN101775_c0_g1_i1.p1 TRINITY_DN101775_c0_g1~~TRINITY_DN101775_c0_g1_i1.p1  ORF type:complete len:532 (+),score=137.65 TRINITY_DN101775_c0_g1_i1:128-1723(+)